MNVYETESFRYLRRMTGLTSIGLLTVGILRADMDPNMERDLKGVKFITVPFNVTYKLEDQSPSHDPKVGKITSLRIGNLQNDSVWVELGVLNQTTDTLDLQGTIQFFDQGGKVIGTNVPVYDLALDRKPGLSRAVESSM